jgi:hypothetical protein
MKKYLVGGVVGATVAALVSKGKTDDLETELTASLEETSTAETELITANASIASLTSANAVLAGKLGIIATTALSYVSQANLLTVATDDVLAAAWTDPLDPDSAAFDTAVLVNRVGVQTAGVIVAGQVSYPNFLMDFPGADDGHEMELSFYALTPKADLPACSFSIGGQVVPVAEAPFNAGGYTGDILITEHVDSESGETWTRITLACASETVDTTDVAVFFKPDAGELTLDAFYARKVVA